MKQKVNKFTACLHIVGDMLRPQEISELLNCMPTHSVAKGDQIVTPDPEKNFITNKGRWSLIAKRPDSEDINKQISDILSQISNDLDKWRIINNKYDASMSCGLFMRNTNEMLAISNISIAALGQRGIRLDLDIYAPTDNVQNAAVTKKPH